MSIEEAIFKLLTTEAPIAGVVGTRVYPLQLPQNSTLPAITYMVTSGDPTHCMGEDSGVAAVCFQLDIWTESYADALDVFRRLKDAIDMYAGTVAGVDIQNLAVTNWMDVDDPEPMEPKIYHRSIDIDVDYVISEI